MTQKKDRVKRSEGTKNKIFNIPAWAVLASETIKRFGGDPWGCSEMP